MKKGKLIPATKFQNAISTNSLRVPIVGAGIFTVLLVILTLCMPYRTAFASTYFGTSCQDQVLLSTTNIDMMVYPNLNQFTISTYQEAENDIQQLSYAGSNEWFTPNTDQLEQFFGGLSTQSNPDLTQDSKILYLRTSTPPSPSLIHRISRVEDTFVVTNVDARIDTYESMNVSMWAMSQTPPNPVPIPPAVFLFGTGLAGLITVTRFKKKLQH